MSEHEYRGVRKINWNYYNKLLAHLSELGVNTDELPFDFPRLHWTAHKEWIERNYPHVFVCPRCQVPTRADVGKHKYKRLCISCADAYNYQPRYAIADRLVGGVMPPRDMIDSDGNMRKVEHGSVGISPDRIRELAAIAREKSVTASAADGASAILRAAGKRVHQQLLESIPTAESPLDVSKTDEATPDSTDKP